VRTCPLCGLESDSAEQCPRDGATLIQQVRERDLIGVILKDTYELRRKIGEGGFGAVYEALQRPLDRPVAVKVLRPGLERNADLVKRFFREARLLSNVSHPNIVQVYDCGNTADGIFFLVMELLEGQSLTQLVPTGGLPFSDLVGLFQQICTGVGEAHRRGLVHRDLKPANVFLTWMSERTPQIKVLDFGLARRVGVDTNITQMGAILGTPGYASPEQITGETDPDARTDIYALGAVLHFMATGAAPYQGKSQQGNTQALLARQLAGPPAPEDLAALAKHPAGLAAVVLRALERTPEKRFQTVDELASALAALARAPAANATAVLPQPGLPAAPFPRTMPLVAPPRTALLPPRLPPTAVLPAVAPRTPEPTSQASIGGVQIVARRPPPRGSARIPSSGRRGLLLGGGAAAVVGAGAFGARHFGILGARPPLTFGMSAAFSGPAENLGRGMRVGLETRFRQANAAGETSRPLLLLPLDDGYEPERTRENMRRLLGVEHVLAIVGNVGTPTAAEALPLATAARTPFVGAFTGAALLRNDPPDRYVFNYRPSYASEIAAMVGHFVRRRRVSPQRIAVFAQNDSFGDAGISGVTKALAQHGVTDASGVLRVGYTRNTTDVADAVEKIVAARDRVDAIILIATYRPAALFIDGLRKAKVKKLLASLSFVGSQALATELQALGAWVDDILVTQVVPLPSANASCVLAYRDALHRHFPEETPGFVSLEGYVVGSLVVEACKRCQRFDGEGLVEALESIRSLDLGLGAPIDYGPSDHDASDRIWGSVIGADYQYQPLDLGLTPAPMLLS
jgi:serine/threonine protein kinase/ABC-type branched-subunit amino acid transport system substrate-binding protein